MRINGVKAAAFDFNLDLIFIIYLLNALPIDYREDKWSICRLDYHYLMFLK